MKGAIRLFKSKLFILVNVILCVSVSPALASAGWYPTAKGESLTVEYCLPTANVGTLYLQALGSGTKWKTVAVVKYPQLKKDSYCADDFKHGFGQGLFHLKYKWKVNISGGWGLRIKSTTLNQTYYGWPDGITTNGK
jgi:hypothetical protein